MCALDEDGSKLTYDKMFHKITHKGYRNKNSINKIGCYKGFPTHKGNWCNLLKVKPMLPLKKNTIQYLGIAVDEPKRIERHNNKENIRLPLAMGFTEKDCRQWCEENDLLSPIYNDSTRGGCWFCHNQTIKQLRLLRKNYPKYWDLLMQWDLESHIKFTPDHSVHDFDRRFEAEELGLVPMNRKFRWKMLDKIE